MRCHGFNLVETLVATLILSGTVVTVGALSTRALNDTHQNVNLERAAALADRQMAMIEAQGVTQFLELGQLQGDFGQMAPGISWSVTYQSLELDQLYQLELTVTWMDHKRLRQFTLKTMLNGSETLIATENNETTASQ